MESKDEMEDEAQVENEAETSEEKMKLMNIITSTKAQNEAVELKVKVMCSQATY